MRRATGFLAVIAFCAASSVHADYLVSDEGMWPDSWPQELEPLREQSRTLVGPVILQRHYEIPFTSREEFEAAWPHLLQVKSEGAPVFLLRPDEKRFMTVDAGVVIHSPPEGTDRRANPEEPIPGPRSARQRWMWTTYIELIVDGDIVDLNRIPLPVDTPIIDERFAAGPTAAAADAPAATVAGRKDGQEQSYQDGQTTIGLGMAVAVFGSARLEYAATKERWEAAREVDHRRVQFGKPTILAAQTRDGSGKRYAIDEILIKTTPWDQRPPVPTESPADWGNGDSLLARCGDRYYSFAKYEGVLVQPLIAL
ncbi:MAG: hypothetical protein WBC44_20555, partial [Planctomycetaceae bacterium]